MPMPVSYTTLSRGDGGIRGDGGSPRRRRLLSLTRMGVFRPHQLSDNSDLHLIHRSRKKSSPKNRNSLRLPSSVANANRFGALIVVIIVIVIAIVALITLMSPSSSSVAI